jgi:hypothetical protein
MIRRRSSTRKKRSVGARHYAALGRAPARSGGLWVVVVLAALVVVNLYVFVWDKNTSVPAIQKVAENKSPAMQIPAPIPAAPAPPEGAGPRSGHYPEASGATIDNAPAIEAPKPVALPSPAPGAIDGKVAKSDTLGRLLKRNGLSAHEADEVIHALSGVLDFKTIRAGQAFHIERGVDGRVRVFELALGKHKVRAERSDKGDLVGKTDGT